MIDIGLANPSAQGQAMLVRHCERSFAGRPTI